jgi:hypothetical protein
MNVKRRKDIEDSRYLVDRANRTVELAEMRMIDITKMFEKNTQTL